MVRLADFALTLGIVRMIHESRYITTPHPNPTAPTRGGWVVDDNKVSKRPKVVADDGDQATDEVPPSREVCSCGDDIILPHAPL